MNEAIFEIAYRVAGDRIEAALYTQQGGLAAKPWGRPTHEVEAAVLAKFPEAGNFEISQAFDCLQKKVFRISILDKQNVAMAGVLDDLRIASCEVGVCRARMARRFSTRRNAGARVDDPGSVDEAQGIDAYGGGELLEALPSALQLPAVQRRRERPFSAARAAAKSVTAAGRAFARARRA